MKLALGLVAATALLASCGSSGVAPDGSVSLVVNTLTTEYVTSENPNNVYVGCDTTTGLSDTTRTNKTQVVVTFTASGAITNVVVKLRGQTTDSFDQYFQQTVNASDLKKNSDGRYQIVFDADSSDGKLLPSSIIVSPKDETPRPLTLVNATNKVDGGFYAEITVNSASSNVTKRSLETIPVYRDCSKATANQLAL